MLLISPARLEICELSQGSLPHEVSGMTLELHLTLIQALQTLDRIDRGA